MDDGRRYCAGPRLAAVVALSLAHHQRDEPLTAAHHASGAAGEAAVRCEQIRPLLTLAGAEAARVSG